MQSHKGEYRFEILGNMDLNRLDLHYPVLKLVICNKRLVLDAVFVGVNGVYRVAQQLCDAFVIMDAHPDEREDPVFRSKQLPFGHGNHFFAIK